MDLYLPNSARLQNIESFVKKVRSSDDPTLSLSMRETYFSVHPVVLAMTAAAGLRARTEGAEVRVSNIPDNPSVRYLERMGLFKLIGVQSGLTAQSVRDENKRKIKARFA